MSKRHFSFKQTSFLFFLVMCYMLRGRFTPTCPFVVETVTCFCIFRGVPSPGPRSSPCFSRTLPRPLGSFLRVPSGPGSILCLSLGHLTAQPRTLPLSCGTC